MNLKSLFGKGVQRPSLCRALRSESLEPRHLMAGDSYLPFHNYLIPEDTNSDYNISPLDALLVINAINSGKTGELIGPGVGKADGPMVDVSADNMLTPLDALRVINRLNAEGEVGDLVGFTFEFTDRNGVALSNNTASVGQLVQLRAFVQDLRGFDAQGVFTAFMDIAYSDPSKFQVNVGEVQSFKYFFDKIDASHTHQQLQVHFRRSNDYACDFVPRLSHQVGGSGRGLDSSGPGSLAEHWSGQRDRTPGRGHDVG